MDGENFKNNKKLLGFSIVIFISLMITYFIPKYNLYQPTLNSLIYITLASIAIIIIIYPLKRYFKTNNNSYYKLVGIFIISTIFFTAIFLSTLFINTPDLSNKNLSEFSESNNDFIIEVSYQNNNDTTKNNVILSQDPKTGLLLPKNSKMSIVVARSEYITITYPSNGEHVGQNISVKGKVYNFQNKTQSLYLFVQPQPKGGDGPYIWYLQPKPTEMISVDVNPDGSWKCNAYFGNSGDVDREFKIVAIVTNGQLTSPYVDYKLPDNIVSSEPVYVTRV